MGRLVAMVGGFILTAGFAAPSGTFVRVPGAVWPSVAPAPSPQSKRAMDIGHQVMRSVMNGQSTAGVVLKESSAKIWIRPLLSKKRDVRVLPLSSEAVMWRGGWRFVGHSGLRHLSVDLVIRNKSVLGVLAYHDAYGRVRKRQGDWVTIQRVTGKLKSNPACRKLTGRPFRARINRGTVWNSKRYLLPRHSLVQYTVYGVPGYPFMLGGVEDYGRAPCHPVRSASGFEGTKFWQKIHRWRL